MYTDINGIVKLHTGGTGKYCTSIARDKVLPICVYLFKSNGFESWFKSTFGHMDDDEFVIWLLDRDSFTKHFNYMVLLAKFYASKVDLRLTQQR